MCRLARNNMQDLYILMFNVVQSVMYLIDLLRGMLAMSQSPDTLINNI
jgi:hypothetical protein